MDNIYTTTEKLIEGVKKACSVIRPTYGAAGSNVIVEEQYYPFHAVRNDGKAIMDKIKLADPIENIGANIMREVGDKADKDSGDGRKTTMILAESILIEAQKSKAQPLEIKRSLDECLPLILKAIDDQTKPISVDEIKSVATISSENEQIGTLIQEIYQKIGKEGIIEVDHSNLPETFYEIVDGVRLRNAGFFGPYSQTEEGRAVYKNPKILISKDKITTVDQVEPLVGALKEKGINELVIYCDDIDMSVASRLALTHIQGVFKTLIIKSPTLWKDWLFEDFAKMTGATIIDAKQGKTFKNLTMEDLGTCVKIVSTKDETRVIGIKDISEHLKNLEEQGLKDDQQKLRASWLNTKVATLKIGANSESELAYTSKKAKDACCASYLALKGGVVSGAGVPLFSIANDQMLKMEGAGAFILSSALQEPIKQIVKNMGRELHQGLSDVGVNIVDAAIVVKNAVTNAISIAGTILTSRAIITLPKDK